MADVDDEFWPMNIVVVSAGIMRPGVEHTMADLLALEEGAQIVRTKPSDMPAVADKPWLVDAKFNLRNHFGCQHGR